MLQFQQRSRYCAPVAYRPVPDPLSQFGKWNVRRRLDQIEITQTYGNGLGVIAANLNGDGWPDLFVANDGNQINFG